MCFVGNKSLRQREQGMSNVFHSTISCDRCRWWKEGLTKNNGTPSEVLQVCLGRVTGEDGGSMTLVLQGFAVLDYEVREHPSRPKY